MNAADRAWELLADGLTPQDIVARLTPQTKAEALHLARRLPLLDERPHDRGAALARLAARVGMTRHRLSFARDGRLVDELARHTPDERDFDRPDCDVTYTPRMFGDQDHFEIDPHDPAAAPLGGQRSHFAAADAVVALGGPEAYLEAYIAAGPDRDARFRRAFEGWEPEVQKPKRRKPVVGEHTARLVPPAVEAEPPEPEPPAPGRLF